MELPHSRSIGRNAAVTVSSMAADDRQQPLQSERSSVDIERVLRVGREWSPTSAFDLMDLRDFGPQGRCESPKIAEVCFSYKSRQFLFRRCIEGR